MRYKSLRQLRRIGKALYVAFPQTAQFELRLFTADWVELELDPDAKTLTIRPVHARTEVPLLSFRRPDMIPATAAALPLPADAKTTDDQQLLVDVAS